jgi:hypothetical protein
MRTFGYFDRESLDLVIEEIKKYPDLQETAYLV